MGSIRLNNNKAETSSAENTFVMLTVKDEPIDYEEYGKLQEFEKPHEDVNNNSYRSVYTDTLFCVFQPHDFEIEPSLPIWHYNRDTDIIQPL
jgi:hypothetical protein